MTREHGSCWRCAFGLASTLVLATACVLPAQRIPTSTRDTDTALRAATVRAISDSLRVPVRVDREPLPLAVDTASASVRRAASTSETEPHSLEEQVADLATIATRAADEPVRSACAGTMVPYSATGSHRGCPQTPEAIVVLGTPRADPTAGAPKGSAIIRALVTYIGPHGFYATLYDYSLRQMATGWILVRRKALLIVE